MRSHHILPRIAVIVGAFLLIAGCGGTARPLDGAGTGQHESSLAGLATLGHTLMWSGGIAGAVGLAVRVAGWFNPTLAIFAGISLIAAEVGSVVLGSGVCLAWLAANPVAIVVGLGGVCTLWLWYRWPSLSTWLDKRRSAKILNKGNDHA